MNTAQDRPIIANEPNQGGDCFDIQLKQEITSSNATIVSENSNSTTLPFDGTKISQSNEDIQNTMSYDKSSFLMPKDIGSLRQNKYDSSSNFFKETFIIKNNKNGQIVELKAANAFHATNLIGWRPRHTTLIGVNKTEETKAVGSIETSATT